MFCKVVRTPHHLQGAIIMPPRRRKQQNQSRVRPARAWLVVGACVKRSWQVATRYVHSLLMAILGCHSHPKYLWLSLISLCPRQLRRCRLRVAVVQHGRNTAAYQWACVILPMERRNSSSSTVPYEPTPMLAERPTRSCSREPAARPKAAAAHPSRRRIR